MKKILILCGGIEAVKSIQTARNMGLYVVVMDGNSECPEKKYAHEFLQANIYDPFDVVSVVVGCLEFWWVKLG